MSANDHITQWLHDLADGDSSAAQKLWEHYFERLMRFARRNLPANTCRGFDEEDVALSAFKSFFLGVEKGRFPQLNDRDNLWSLLVVITARKANARRKHENRRKRGDGNVRGESVFAAQGSSDDLAGINGVLGHEPTPSFAAQCLEEYQRLLDALNDPVEKEIVLLRMQGYKVDEIADQLGQPKRSVERKLEIIRKTWQKALDDKGN